MKRLPDKWQMAMSISCLTSILVLVGCAGDPVGTGRSGSLTVRTTTTGGAFDPDGFELLLDGNVVGTVDVNAGRYLSVPEGLHSLALAGLAPNCLGGSPQDVMTDAGSQSEVRFQASCTPAPELAAIRILFAGPGGVVAMNADGSDRVTLVSGSGLESPDISADGARLAFVRRTDGGSELWVAEADGTDQRRLAAGFARDPRWSPGGGEIAYTNWDGLGNGGIWLTSLADTLTERLTDVDFIDDWHRWPSWSPDGSHIVFDAGGSLALLSRDGTQEYLAPGVFPAWSPEGRIAYVGYEWPVSKDIKVIHADGTGAATMLTTPAGSSAQPRAWSSDGTLLLYTDVSVGEGTDVYLLDVEGGTTVRVTGDDASSSPVFWPTVY